MEKLFSDASAKYTFRENTAVVAAGALLIPEVGTPTQAVTNVLTSLGPRSAGMSEHVTMFLAGWFTRKEPCQVAGHLAP
jgi:hypothetical protein